MTWRTFCVACAGALLCAGTSWGMPPDAPWSLQLPEDGPVPYRGIANLDQAGSHASTQVMYPGGHVAVFLGAILVHGAVVEAEKDKQKQKLQQGADAQVAAQRDALASFTRRDLMQAALVHMPGHVLLGPSESAGGWVVSASPSFSVTADRRALVLDNTVSVFAPENMAKPAYTRAVRVVSRPREEADVAAFWDNGAASARLESSQMVAHSLKLALDQRRGAEDPAPFRTLRYPEGGLEKVERAQPLQRLCQRLVLRTLRGSLLSVPAQPADEHPQPCEAALPGWK